MAQINTRIVLRNDSLANWEANSHVVLLKGEVGVAYNDDGSARIKLGDGVRSWAELEWFGGDTNTITNVTENIVQEMIGAPADPESGEEATGIFKDVEDLENALGAPADEEAGTEATGIYKDIEDLQDTIGTPADPEAGTEATGVYKELADIVNATDAKIDAAVAEKFGEITDNGKVDTVLELINYVEDHGEETAKIVTDITDLQGLVGSVPVEDQIKALLSEQKLVNDELYEAVKYEVSSAPAGTLVSYGDSEIRVMCPKDTVFTKQNSGAGADTSAYYIGFKAYAPANAVSFKEDLAEIIADPEMYSFEGNDFAGTDKYGRKYSIIWLPVANLQEDGTWIYHGSKSSKAKYMGWYYTVEWYDADGKIIESDTVRVNLSNEDCHNNPEPYYMGSIIKEVAVNGALCDVANNRVNIGLDNIVKSSDEIVVNEDGSLSIAQLDASKLVNGDTTLVINGGGAAM